MSVDLLLPLRQAQTVERPFARTLSGCTAVDAPPDLYDALLARLRREYIPYSVLWELTHVCNLKCVMCYNELLHEPELSKAECFDVLVQLARAGTLQLTFTGGEILARRDFFVIAEEARRLGFALALKTNGTLITPEVADQIAALAPVQVDISLLGAAPETFDAVSGVSRSLERVLRGVQLLQERRVRVKLNTLLLDLNVDERQEMVDLALRLGVPYEQVLKVSPTDTGHDGAAQHQLSRVQMHRALVDDNTPMLVRPVEPEGRTCSVGLSSCVISPYGVVYPCIELRVPAGDLRRERFEDIWLHAGIFADLRSRHIRMNLDHCSACLISGYCEGRCAGIAWKEHGNPYAGHTLACWHAQARYAEQHPDASIPDTPYLRERRSAAKGCVSSA